jgi:hypothetical protein
MNFFVGIFFNSALLGCANIRLSGGQPAVGAAFRMALSRVVGQFAIGGRAILPAAGFQPALAA